LSRTSRRCLTRAQRADAGGHADNLALVEHAVLEACDASDGVRDNVIGTPDTCRFSLAGVKACRPNDTAAPDCLTAAQRIAIAAIYAPPRPEAVADLTGVSPWVEERRGESAAGNGSRSQTRDRWRAPTDRPRACRWPRARAFKYMVFENPKLGLHRYDLANWSRDTKLNGADPERRQS
jgi:hypothetical protein